MPQHGKKSKRREKAVLVAKMRGISGDFRRHGLNQPHVILDRKSRRLANLRKRDAEDRAGLLRDDRASAECRTSTRTLKAIFGVSFSPHRCSFHRIGVVFTASV
mmetsp:Transcript_22781/g.70458  ORF Transcript_22781/g.70458 Transcript_22781/m.70458 type:complete len:104 (+) Transcript_22781:183-494(+)